MRTKTLRFDGIGVKPRLTHYMFRFPAKFHPPFVRWALEQYSAPGDLVLDPLNGSGTTLLESIVTGRNALGSDVDPLACLMSKVKTTPLDPCTIERRWTALNATLKKSRRRDAEYERLKFDDIAQRTFSENLRTLWTPAIEPIEHWFRRYVIVDLARIRKAIMTTQMLPAERRFFVGCFAGIIRRSSNADPVPVSGLEVTSHMKAMDEAGRVVNPFELLERKVVSEIAGLSELWNATGTSNRVRARTWNADVRALGQRLRSAQLEGAIDLVITSPPYCNAVDYARRHKLEAFWLRLVDDHEAHRELARRYIGTTHVRRGGGPRETGSRRVDSVVKEVWPRDHVRGVALAEYFAGLDAFFATTRQALHRGGHLVLVLGDSRVAGIQVPTFALATEIGSRYLEHEQTFAYKIQNRYMHYSRRNGADIGNDRVAIFRKA